MDQIYSLTFQTVSSCALLIIVYIFHGLSQRLGEAMQIKPYYHLFSIGFVFIFLSLLVRGYVIFNCASIPDFQKIQIIILIYLLLAIGVTLSFIAGLKYWGWLLKEIF